MKNIFENKIKGDLKSLYLIDNDSEEIINSFLEFLDSRSSGAQIFQKQYDSFTIDESRNIASLHNEKQNDSGQVFIIQVRYFTNEAQNSLLKLFEDTNHKNHFFIFCKNTGQFLDTVLSRSVLIKFENINDNIRGQDFLKKNKNARIKEVAEIIKNHKADTNSAFLRDDARDLVDSLESYMHSNDNFKKQDVWKFSELNKARKYLSTPGASVKMILEHLSVVL